MSRASSTRTDRAPRSIRLAALVLALLVAACGGGSDGLALENVRARTALASAGFGAVYLDITNDTDTDDELVGGTVDESVAAAVELHETRPVASSSEGTGVDDDAAMASPGAGTSEMAPSAMAPSDATSEGEGAMMSGMEGMEMVEVERIALPAGQTVSLAPGGLHIMLIDLADDLVEGDEFALDLEFAEAGTRSVTVTVTMQP